MRTILPITLGLICLFGCGPSKEEQQAIQATEKAKMDSVVKATAISVRLQDSLKKVAEQAVMDSLFQAASAELVEEMDQKELKEKAIVLKAQLAAEEAKMGGILEWKLGRTQAEKVEQIQNQTLVIESLKAEIADIEGQIK